MKRFCQECGTPAQLSDVICTECGNKIEQLNTVPTVPVERKPMSKMKKIYLSSIACLLAALVGLYMYGSSYTSADNTLDRFQKAVFNQDKETLLKMMEYEGGTKLSDGELEAVIAFGEKKPSKFIKSIGPWGHVSETFLYSLKQTGKTFGVFDGHKIIITDQFFIVPLPYDELSYTLNEEKVDMTTELDRGVIGPVAPGFYDLVAVYEGEFATVTKSFELELLERFDDIDYVHVDLDLDEVTFRLEDPSITDPDKSYILIGDKEIPFNEEGYIHNVGPFVLDGSSTVKVISEFPWGTFESDEVEIIDDYLYLRVNGYDEEVEKKALTTLVEYGEQYVAARVAVDTTKMNTITDGWRKTLQGNFEYSRWYSGYNMGLLDSVHVATDNSYVTKSNGEYKFIIPAYFQIESAFGIDENSVEVREDGISCSIELVYIDGEWKVANCVGNWFQFSDTATILEGSKTLHKPVFEKEDIVEDVAESVMEEDEEASESDE